MDNQSSGTIQSPSTFSDSSRTGSSSQSAASTEKERELDLTKDNAASPVDLECIIQAERITKLLNEAIFKTKLAICLPKLVHQFSTLSSQFTTQHLDDLMFIFEQYDNPLFSTSLVNMAAMEDIKGGDITLKNRLNPELGHLIYIMNSYPKLRVTVEDIIEEMRMKYVSYETTPPKPSLEYLLLLEQFRDLLLRQMASTAADILQAKITTRKLEESNAKLIEIIDECQTTLKDENIRFEETMALKRDIIAKLEGELAALSYEVRLKLDKKILDSDRQMVLATRSHDLKYEMLLEEEEETTEGYENVLRLHLKEEKNQRARRCKVETQLLSWLQKYDLEMGDKQVELNELTEQYEDEVSKVEALEEKLTAQDKEFVPLMEEREVEYHQEMTEKMIKFLTEHAARIIQVSWRNVLANRSEKKKLKKLQKKMQAEAEAAEKKSKKEGKKK